jgi:hypothetical protein
LLGTFARPSGVRERREPRVIGRGLAWGDGSFRRLEASSSSVTVASIVVPRERGTYQAGVDRGSNLGFDLASL